MKFSSSVFLSLNPVILLRNLLLFIILISIGNKSTAQTVDDDQARTSSVLAVPGVPSPTAASLGQYANYTVSNFTGTPDINVPIYEINQSGFKLPISLSYNASGIKVSDISSWVGMGWTLNCGGVITRNVRDIPDDDNRTTSGWLKYNYTVLPTAWDSGALTSGYSPLASTDKKCIGLKGLRDIHGDTEPDIFYYNFNGHVGKFFFNQGSDTVYNSGQIPRDQHTINLIPYKDIKFSYRLLSGGSTSDGLLESFTAIDESGNTYVFDQRELTSSRGGPAGFFLVNREITGLEQPSTASMGYFSSWYLSKIITAQNQVITFTYAAESYHQVLPTSYSVRNFTRTSTNTASVDCSVGYVPQNSNITNIDNWISGQRLTAIEGPDFKISFEANEARQDLLNSAALTDVVVYSKNSAGILSLIKRIKLDYSYLQSPAGASVGGSSIYGDPFKRLLLNKVTEMDKNSNLLKPYVFEYNNAIPLPNRYSPHQDFWGYSNNNTCNTLIPTVYIYPGEGGNDRFSLYQKADYAGTDEFIINGADRTTNTAAALSGTLSKITFPLGGYEQFTFESNEFYYLNQNIKGGGLCLQKSVRYDGINHANDIVREYTYKTSANPAITSGMLFNLPVFAYTENFYPYWRPTETGELAVWPRLYGELDPDTFGYYLYNLVVTSAPNFTLSGYDGINVGYSEITEHQSNNGFIVSKYSTPGHALLNNDIAGDGCDVAKDGYCDGLFKAGQVEALYSQIPLNCPNGLPDPNDKIDTIGLEFTSNGYPFAPKLNYEWNRGLLVSQKYLTEGNKLTKEVINDYVNYTPKKKWPSYIYGLRRGRPQNYRLYTSTCWSTNGMLRFDVVCRYPIITNIAKVISKTTTKNYSSLNNDVTESISNYKYSGNQLEKSEVATTTNSNERISKKYFYPMDYNLNEGLTSSDSFTQGIKNLRKGHVTSQVIQTYTEKQDATGNSPSILGGKLLQFFGTSPFPEKLYEIQSSTPISGSGQISVSNDVASIPAMYTATNLFKRTSNGNIIENRFDDKISNAYIWAYNNQYMVASVNNATSYDIACTGFTKDEGGGGWTQYNESNVVADLNVPNNWAYNLGPDLIKTGLTTSKSYVVELSYKAGSAISIKPASGTIPLVVGPTILGWTKASCVVANTTTLTVAGTGQIDNLRIYPADAQMTAYTYDPLIGVTSTTDAKGRATYYEYDGFLRLKDIKDQNGNIVKKFDYHYQGQ